MTESSFAALRVAMPVGIGPAGDIVGTVADEEFHLHAFLRKADGTISAFIRKR